MKLRVDKQDTALVLELEGELDVDGSAKLEERCLYEQQEGARHFVVSLGAVTRITGPGLRVLLGLARGLPRSGGSLVLCELDQRVEEALRVSGPRRRVRDRARSGDGARALSGAPVDPPTRSRRAAPKPRSGSISRSRSWARANAPRTLSRSRA